MAEVIFILITVYAVYVVHSIITSKEKKKDKAPVIKAKIPVATASKKEETKAAVKQEKPVVKKAVPAKAKPKPKAKAKVNVKAKTKVDSGNLRNPETGEEAKIASSYRMCKRWIKEALVTEGLLEKVYKTNEIDDAAKVKIDKALVKLAKMEKYK